MAVPQCKYHLIFALIMLAMICFLFHSHAVSYYPALDEGVSLNAAIRIIDGEAPYRDFFHITTPLSAFSIAGAFAAFKPTLFTARMLYLAFGLSLCIVLYMVSLKLIDNPSLSLLPPLGYFLFDICLNFYWTPYIPCIFFFLLTTMMFQGIKSWKEPFLAGIFASLCFLTNQNIGAWGFIGSVVILATIRRMKATPLTSMRWYLLGFSIPTIVFLSYLLIHHALTDFLYECLLWPLTKYYGFNKYPYLYKEASSALSALYLLIRGKNIIIGLGLILSFVFYGLLPFVLYPLCLLSAFMKNRWNLWVTSVGGVSLFLSSFNHPDFLHLLHVMSYLLIIFFFMVGEICQRFLKDRGMGSLIAVIGAFVLVLFPLLECAWFILSALSLPVYKIETIRGDVSLTSPRLLMERERLLRYISRHVSKDRSVFVYHWSPEIYFLSGMRNPTPFDSYKPIYNSREQMMKIIRSLDETKPSIVIKDNYIDRFFDPGDIISLSFPLVDRDLLLKEDIVQQFITRSYRLEVKIHNYTIYTR